jgi:predicted MFS family arabinose efflux permease
MQTMSVATGLIVAIWGFLHTPCFLTGQVYMISFAPEAPEFANSLAISFGNLGISVGTLLGGLVFEQYGVHNTTWAMCLFCFIALSLLSIQVYNERSKKYQDSAFSRIFCIIRLSDLKRKGG